MKRKSHKHPGKSLGTVPLGSEHTVTSGDLLKMATGAPETRGCWTVNRGLDGNHESHRILSIRFKLWIISNSTQGKGTKTRRQTS